MKENIKKTMIKTTAIVLTAAMAITLSPVCSGAKVKKPAFDSESYYLREGESVTAKVKKNGNAIKSTIWKSGNKKIFTIKKKSNTKAAITGIKQGTAKLRAVVKTKGGKSYNLTTKVQVDDPEYSLLTSYINWTKPESPEISAELQTTFNKAMADYASEGTYTPVALLGTYMMGTDADYFVFARRTPLTAGGKSTYVLITIHDDLTNSVVSDMIVTDVEIYAEGSDGWNETETPLIDKTADLVFQQAVAEVDGFACTPLALLAMRKTNETDYCFITEFLPLGDNAVPSCNLMQINVNDAGAVKIGNIINLTEGRENASGRETPQDKADLDMGKYYVALTEEAVSRAFGGGRKRGLDGSGNVLWDFTFQPGYDSPYMGYFEFINMHDVYGYGDGDAYTYCTGLSNLEMTTRGQTKTTNYEIIKGKYNFKKDFDEILIGWQMFEGKTTKAEIQTRINNTISDDVFKKIKALNPDNKDYTVYGNRFIIYGYDSKKGQVVGKFIGVETDRKGNYLYFDVIGCNPNDTNYYGKRITEALYNKSVNQNYD